MIKKLLKLFINKQKLKNTPLPDAIQTNAGILTLNYPEDGGVEVYFPGHKYPMEGIPDTVVVEKISNLKRLIPVTAKMAWISIKNHIPDPENYSPFTKEIHRILSTVREREGVTEMRGKWTEIRDIVCMVLESELNPRVLDKPATQKIGELKNQFGNVIVEYLWQIIRDYKLNPKMLCRCNREVWRLMDIIRETAPDNAKDFIYKLKAIACMGLEFDDAYRYRFMDAMSEFDKKAIDVLDGTSYEYIGKALKQADWKQFDFDEASRYWAPTKYQYFYGFLQKKHE